jgi:enolase-phosphatase E1
VSAARVTFSLRDRGIQAVLLDIEGTTTPVSFVYDILFPFARRALPAFVRERLDAPELREPLRLLHDEWLRDVANGQVPPPWDESDDGGAEDRAAARERYAASIVAYAEWLMDHDRKATGLKALQGLITKHGYQDGRLHGEVYADVPVAFARWRNAGVRIAIFSSGSALAQRMLFQTATAGDLTPSIEAFFDTTVGPKREAESYRRIAAALACPVERVLFISDVAAELVAAREAGCAVLLCVRPGPPASGAADAANTAAAAADNGGEADSTGDAWTMIRDFSEVVVA